MSILQTEIFEASTMEMVKDTIKIIITHKQDSILYLKHRSHFNALVIAQQ